MSPTITLVLVAILILVPALLIVGLWRKKPDSKIAWILTAVLTTAFVGYVLLASRWDASSYYLRPLVALALLAALVVSGVRAWRAPWWTRPTGARGWLSLGTEVVVAILFVGLCGLTVAGTSPGSIAAVNLAMPLRDGVVYVGQGGASTVLNYHHAYRSQAYAVDLLGLNAAGRTSYGLQPSGPAAYAIFGRAVSSPCSGAVVESRGDLADLHPPAADAENATGNHVVIRCDDTAPTVDVTLAHLQHGSVTVAAGAQVSVGDRLGRVGNTGNTTEPHLHVHAIVTGSGTGLDAQGVPIRFDGRFLLRNDLIIGSGSPHNS